MIKARPAIMGIVNVTPDSFSGDGVVDVLSAVPQALQMVQDGANILDIGGESSRPGADPVSVEEEMRRVVPVIRAIRKTGCAIPIAVDTVKAVVAEAALQAGATLINDISALAGDPRMAEIVAKYRVPVVLMHNSAHAGTVSLDATIGGEYKAAPTKGDILHIVEKDLLLAVDKARQAGIATDKIILDPGIGFGKTMEQNLALINHVDQLKARGYPVLVGPSRKSFIGRALGLTVNERLEGTAACVAMATLRGADIIRVHDVKFMARVAKMTAFISDN